MTNLPGSRLIPIPLELRLQNFSLYENQAQIQVNIAGNVLCIAGANGLGKSTFLNTLNFAITGVVAEPGRKFDSLPEYYRHTAPYARSYFDGRISADDRGLASVRIKLQVGGNRYTIERRFFDSESLTYFEVASDSGMSIRDADFDSDAERNAAYKARITADCGLAQFEQLVFLQHFLLTFDEQHRLLLWDERTLDQTLLLAFGVDASAAAKADDHRRKAERLDSQARNLQYQATTAEGRIQDLKNRVTAAEAEAEVGAQSFDELEEEWRTVSGRVERLTGELNSAQTVEADAHARLSSIEQAYEDAFQQALAAPNTHPIVINSLQSDRCDLCGTAGAADRLSPKLEAHVCPLCEASTAPTGGGFSGLEELSAELGTARNAARAATAQVSELVSLRMAALDELASIDSDRMVLETGDGNDAAMSQATVQKLITQYELEALDARQRRDEFRVRRDEHKKALKPIARELAIKYADGEARFVPRFTALAHSFLGLDVEVYLQQRGAKASLVVAVEGTERRTFDQLSESQRYFLDIALRMALVDYMAGPGSGCLYVDTPEGSLDISYEERAGQMFANFAADNRLIMTANINTSQLLLSLARRSTQDSMQIVRMMEWTTLSEVQAAGEQLFTQAFGELNEALRAAREVS